MTWKARRQEGHRRRGRVGNKVKRQNSGVYSKIGLEGCEVLLGRVLFVAKTKGSIDGCEIFVILVLLGFLGCTMVETAHDTLAMSTGELKIAKALLLLQISPRAHGYG